MLTIKGLKCLGRGSVCRCYALSRHLVLKCYQGEKTRDHAFTNQLLGWRRGVGPEPWGRRHVDHPEGFIYGYISQRAVVCRDWRPDLANELEDRMREIGLSPWDICGSNMGTLSSGRLVCIDFDPLSVERGERG